MRELSTIQNWIFGIGALMMVAGVGCLVFGIMPQLTSVVFAIGATTFSLLQMSQTYSGPSLTIRRLRTIMVLADICFIAAALLQLENTYQFLQPLFCKTIDGTLMYMQYVHNNWVVALLIGAVLELYSINRISYELKKES